MWSYRWKTSSEETPHRNAPERFGGKDFQARFRCIKGRESVLADHPFSVQLYLFIVSINKSAPWMPLLIFGQPPDSDEIKS